MDELREKLLRILQGFDNGVSMPATLDAILAIPEIEAGVALYLASIEERDDV